MPQPTNETWEEKFDRIFFMTPKGVFRMRTTIIDGEQYYKTVTPEDIKKLISEERKRAFGEGHEQGHIDGQEVFAQFLIDGLSGKTDPMDQAAAELRRKYIIKKAQSLGLKIKE